MKDDRLYLHHMVERCHRITRFIAAGREEFMTSEQLQDAVIRNVEVIGEAAKRVSAEARGRLPSLDWKAICGMRDGLYRRGSRRSLERRVLADTRAPGGTGSVSGRRKSGAMISTPVRAETWLFI